MTNLLELQENLQDLNNQLLAAKEELKEANQELKDFDLSDYISYDQYDDFLDDVHPEVEYCGYTSSASHVLKMMDEIAYDQGYNEFVDNQDPEDFGEYTDIQERIEEQENIISTIEEEIEEIENSIVELQDGEE